MGYLMNILVLIVSLLCISSGLTSGNLLIGTIGMMGIFSVFGINKKIEESLTEKNNNENIKNEIIKPVVYNVNGKCTLTNNSCGMVKDLGICNCEMCKLNTNKGD